VWSEAKTSRSSRATGDRGGAGKIDHAHSAEVVRIRTGVRGEVRGARSRDGANATGLKDWLLVDISAEILALAEGVLIYPFPLLLLLRFLLGRGLVVGLPVISAVRGSSLTKQIGSPLTSSCLLPGGQKMKPWQRSDEK
jgi:hypothetical protein